ncbi:MAG: hypothetical protein VKK59_02445 [Vampirovibrionales bacterium]|nr:hypothetical protein [Vampirovibrionales bacterium]
MSFKALVTETGTTLLISNSPNDHTTPLTSDTLKLNQVTPPKKSYAADLEIFSQGSIIQVPAPEAWQRLNSRLRDTSIVFPAVDLKILQQLFRKHALPLNLKLKEGESITLEQPLAQTSIRPVNYTSHNRYLV